MKLAIIGVGLIGGSLGLALKKKLGTTIKISGSCRSEASQELALKLGAIDEAYSDPVKAVEGADIVYLSTPVLSIPPLIKRILPHLNSGAIITDAGSTKAHIWQEIKAVLPPDIYYIPGHPMTGREKSGVEAARADLFKGKAYVILTGGNAPPSARERLLDLIKVTEARIVTMDLERHDSAAALISHTPHVAAAALVTLLAQNPDMAEIERLIGGGFKDTTRIASSNADMWTDICLTNGEAINADLQALRDILGRVMAAIERQDREAIHAYFANAKAVRDGILSRTATLFDPN